MNKGLKIFIPGLAVAFAAGCGGGGGGGNSGPAAANPELAAITAENAADISGEVVDNVEETAELGRFGDFGGMGVAAAPGDPSLSKAAVAAATKAGTAQSGGLRTILYAAFELTEAPCEVSGTVSISADLKSNDSLSAGDFIEFSFNQCDNGEGEVVDGRVAWSIQSFSGDPDTGFFRLAARLSFDNLTATEGTETGSINGAIDSVVDTESYPLISASQSGERLSMTDGVHTVILEDWITAVTADESSQPHAYTWDASGSISVPEHGGAVTYNVLETFTGFGENPPDSGVLLIEGKDGGNIKVTVVSQGQVQIDVDYEGDGVVDDSKLVAWEDLDD
jgi:hypothetical protein